MVYVLNLNNETTTIYLRIILTVLRTLNTSSCLIFTKLNDPDHRSKVPDTWEFLKMKNFRLYAPPPKFLNQN